VDCIVLEKNPPKQGLKQDKRNPKIREYWGFREKSTKTRIETWILLLMYLRLNWVLEKNPPKQGLKHTHIDI